MSSPTTQTPPLGRAEDLQDEVDPSADAGGLSVLARYAPERIATFRENGWWGDDHIVDLFERQVNSIESFKYWFESF